MRVGKVHNKAFKNDDGKIGPNERPASQKQLRPPKDLLKFERCTAQR